MTLVRWLLVPTSRSDSAEHPANVHGFHVPCDYWKCPSDSQKRARQDLSLRPLASEGSQGVLRMQGLCNDSRRDDRVTAEGSVHELCGNNPPRFHVSRIPAQTAVPAPRSGWSALSPRIIRTSAAEPTLAAAVYGPSGELPVMRESRNAMVRAVRMIRASVIVIVQNKSSRRRRNKSSSEDA